MTQGRSIRLFLVDGSPSGLLTAEIINWTGHVLTGPRTKIQELVGRPECKQRTGVYFLIGPETEEGLFPQVYIGESDDVAKRLIDHNRESDKGGKDFWERACIVTSKDQSLTKAHIKYLESKLISIARSVCGNALTNSTDHSYEKLSESDSADMDFFLEQVRIILPVLGFDFLRDRTKTQQPTSASPTEQTVTEAPRFALSMKSVGITATAQEINGEFVVLKGSSARGNGRTATSGYSKLFEQLVKDAILAMNGENYEFKTDYTFSSPSAASDVITGSSTNGRTMWKLEGTNQTYADWKNSQLPSPTESVETP